MIPTEDLVTIARAIERSRPTTVGRLHSASAWRDAQVDATARSIADSLWPRLALTQDCTRRMFLLSAGLDAEAARVRPCGPQSGCASDPGPNVS